MTMRNSPQLANCMKEITEELKCDNSMENAEMSALEVHKKTEEAS